MKRVWKKESTERVFTCPFIKVDKTIYSDNLGYSDSFFSLPFSDWVHVVPRLSDGRILMISQFRFGAEAESLEFPGGQIDPGDSSLEAARKELLQETGYVAESMQYAGWTNPNPAIQANKCHFYFADNIKKEKDQDLEPGEDISVYLYSEQEVDALLKSGKITHSLAVVAYLKCKNFRGLSL